MVPHIIYTCQTTLVIFNLCWPCVDAALKSVYEITACIHPTSPTLESMFEFDAIDDRIELYWQELRQIDDVDTCLVDIVIAYLTWMFISRTQVTHCYAKHVDLSSYVGRETDTNR